MQVRQLISLQSLTFLQFVSAFFNKLHIIYQRPINSKIICFPRLAQLIQVVHVDPPTLIFDFRGY